jgi:ribosome-associated toxin RatA of RatAB toxin-antitoxin module
MNTVHFRRLHEVEGDPDRVWALLSDIGRYPEHMSSVRSVELTRSDGARFSRWRVSARGHLLDWMARDEFDDGLRRYSFSLVEGDFEVLEGTWSVLAGKTACTLHFDMAFDIGIPVLSNTLHPVLEEVLSENVAEIARSIRERSCLGAR